MPLHSRAAKPQHSTAAFMERFRFSAARAVRALLVAIFTIALPVGLVAQDRGPGAGSTSSAAVPANLPQAAAAAPQNDVVIRGGTVLTATHGAIANGSVDIHNGKIASLGATVNTPARATGLEATGS